MLSVVTFAQHKIEESKAYNVMCFLAMDTSTTRQLIQMKNALYEGDRNKVLQTIRSMKRSLQEFDLYNQNRSFQLWYQGNYTDFKNQVINAKNSTLTALDHFERKFKRNDLLYYDRRQFLEMYLSFIGEYYYPDFWFMTIERYFSEATVARLRTDNTGKPDLFSRSQLFQLYAPMNQLAKEESSEVEQYLRIDALNQGFDFQPYIYFELTPQVAADILDSFSLRNRTLDIPTDRQIDTLIKRLQDLAMGRIQIIVRFNKFLEKRQ